MDSLTRASLRDHGHGAGKPVSVTTGEMYFSQTDGTAGEVGLTRSYSSAAIATGRYGSMFGPGWNTSLDRPILLTLWDCFPRV